MKKTAKQTVRASDKAARAFVSKLGGRATRASGSGLEKGDGRVRGKFRTETKCPPTGRYRITFNEWDKIWKAAISGGETALMHLKLYDVELVVMRQQDFVGYNGVIDERAYDLGVLRGHVLSKDLWMRGLQWSPQMIFALTNGADVRNFILIGQTEFLKLMGET